MSDNPARVHSEILWDKISEILWDKISECGLFTGLFEQFKHYVWRHFLLQYFSGNSWTDIAVY